VRPNERREIGIATEPVEIVVRDAWHGSAQFDEPCAVAGSRSATSCARLRAQAAAGGVAAHRTGAKRREEADGVTEPATARRVPLGSLAAFARAPLCQELRPVRFF
jgi:hypothetical protein